MDEKTAPPPYNAYQPSLNAYQSRTFDIHYAGWPTNITVTDPSTNQTVCVLRGSGSRGRFEITNAGGQLLGATKTSSMTSKIEVEMGTTYGQQVQFEIKNDKLMGMVGSPQYGSPAFGGQTMTWKNTAMSKDIIYTLVEGKGMALAKFQSNRHTQVGTLEIADPSVDDVKMNEIMVVLLTLVRRKLKQIQDATMVAIVS